MSDKKTVSYLIPSSYGEAEFEEKRSRFIGRVWPVEEEAEALARIGEMRSKHYDATHNVYAYIIRNRQTRYSDDGEPQGTSGLPTLNVFQSEGVFNVCCVITRYYGGILLGAGGLVRAYSKAAKLALDAAGKSIVRKWDIILLPSPYSMFERFRLLVQDHGGIIESSEFAADVLLQILMPVENSAVFLRKVTDISSATVEAEIIETVFRAVPS
ncbi:YigZ family protein [Desulfovibrio sp. OttesenSCG-928-C06]|nr:YigZ family protein [Desulfovibrio sp. OttesenSCG-928-C06]